MDRWDTALVFSKNNNVCSYQVLDSGSRVTAVFFFFFLGGGGGGGAGGWWCEFSASHKKKRTRSIAQMFGFKLIHDVGYLP